MLFAKIARAGTTHGGTPYGQEKENSQEGQEDQENQDAEEIWGDKRRRLTVSSPIILTGHPAGRVTFFRTAIRALRHTAPQRRAADHNARGLLSHLRCSTASHRIVALLAD